MVTRLGVSAARFWAAGFSARVVGIDAIVNGRDSLPRGYYYEVTGRGYEQLCLPVDVECTDDMTRVFAGKNADRSAAVVLADPAGKPRLTLRVDASGNAAIEFLDGDGHIVEHLPRAK